MLKIKSKLLNKVVCFLISENINLLLKVYLYAIISVLKGEERYVI